VELFGVKWYEKDSVYGICRKITQELSVSTWISLLTVDFESLLNLCIHSSWSPADCGEDEWILSNMYQHFFMYSLRLVVGLVLNLTLSFSQGEMEMGFSDCKRKNTFRSTSLGLIQILEVFFILIEI